MNKDMMPLLLFLLFAEAQKQQSDKTMVLQSGSGVDTTSILNNFSSVFDGIEFLKSEDVKILAAQSANAAEVSVIHMSLAQLSQSNAAFQTEQREKIDDIRQSIDEIKLKIDDNSQTQLTAITGVKESVETIRSNLDIKKLIEDWLQIVTDKDGNPFAGIQDYFNRQIQAFNDLFAAVADLNEKLGLLDKIQDIDRLTSKVTALEKAITASRKRN